MAESMRTEDSRPRRPVLRAAVVLGGLAALAWWRQARRDTALVERTRARLAGIGLAGQGEPATAEQGATSLGNPGQGAADAPSTNAFLASDRPAGPRANHHYSPDLTGLRVG